MTISQFGTWSYIGTPNFGVGAKLVCHGKDANGVKLLVNAAKRTRVKTVRDNYSVEYEHSYSMVATRHVTTVAIDVGDWLDVMDSEGVWNVAQIIKFPSDTEVEVTYDGWGPEYNEVVMLNSDRVAPLQSYTWTVKCWAKYKKWPWWPSVVTFRSPGTARGQEHLAHETRMFVDFLDNDDLSKRCRCWIDTSLIQPFDEAFKKHHKPSGDPRYKASFARAIMSRGSVEFDELVKGGTLPAKFKAKLADPVTTMRASIGLNDWINKFNSNQRVHSDIYVCANPKATPDHDASGTSSQGTEVEDSKKRKTGASTAIPSHAGSVDSPKRLKAGKSISSSPPVPAKSADTFPVTASPFASPALMVDTLRAMELAQQACQRVDAGLSGTINPIGSRQAPGGGNDFHEPEEVTL